MVSLFAHSWPVSNCLGRKRNSFAMNVTSFNICSLMLGPIFPPELIFFFFTGKWFGENVQLKCSYGNTTMVLTETVIWWL